MNGKNAKEWNLRIYRYLILKLELSFSTQVQFLLASECPQVRQNLIAEDHQGHGVWPSGNNMDRTLRILLPEVSAGQGSNAT